jgi:hypothetical protein
VFVEVPLWYGRARITAAPFESLSELDPPHEVLRELIPPEFGDWTAVLSVSSNPAEWIGIPEEFTIG